MSGRAQAQTKFALALIGIFAGIALVLAAVGLYSVLSTIVRQRQAEIGVRMAFGAEHGRIFRMMVVQGLKLSAAGSSCGVAAALILTSVIRSLLVGVEPTDPATFAAMAGRVPPDRRYRLRRPCAPRSPAGPDGRPA